MLMLMSMSLLISCYYSCTSFACLCVCVEFHFTVCTPLKRAIQEIWLFIILYFTAVAVVVVVVVAVAVIGVVVHFDKSKPNIINHRAANNLCMGKYVARLAASQNMVYLPKIHFHQNFMYSYAGMEKFAAYAHV